MISRRTNFLGQMRIDVPHLKAAESSVSNDFDLLAGNIMAQKSPLVVRGFTISMTNAVGNPAASLQMVTADSALIHPGATEAGSIFATDSSSAPQLLSSTNAKVEGSFTASASNYIGIDLRRSQDRTTVDTVMFLSFLTKVETAQSVPLAITLDYKILISTTAFEVTPHVCPIAVVVTDAGNAVVSVTDARNMLGRLAPGGSDPDQQGSFTWPQGRLDGSGSANAFIGGDKTVSSLKGSLDSIMTRLWELGGGERWFAATSDRDLKVTYGQPVLVNGDNFLFDSGTGHLDWASVVIVFANSTGSKNEVRDSSSVGQATLADGQCLYVDVDRTQNLTGGGGLVPQVADLLTLGSPTVPGSRFILAWRVGSDVFARDKDYEVGRSFTAATTTALGLVQLTGTPGSATHPLVPPVNTSGTVAFTATTAGSAAFAGLGLTSGSGVTGQGGATAGATGVTGTAGGTGSLGSTTPWSSKTSGVFGIGRNVGAGVEGNGGGADGPGGRFAGGGTNGMGVSVQGAGSGAGGTFTGGSSAGIGVVAQGGAGGTGVSSTGGSASAGGTFTGGTTSGKGVVGQGTGTGNGVEGTGGTGTTTSGVKGFAGGTGTLGDVTAIKTGVFGVGKGTGPGVSGNGGGDGGIGVNGTGVGNAAGGFFQGDIAGGGAGVQGAGGGVSGAGGVFSGGSPNGDAIQVTGTGTGKSISIQSGDVVPTTNGTINIGDATHTFNIEHVEDVRYYDTDLTPASQAELQEIRQINLPVLQVAFLANNNPSATFPARSWNATGATVGRTAAGHYTITPNQAFHTSSSIQCSLRPSDSATFVVGDIGKYDVMAQYISSVIHIFVSLRTGPTLQDPVTAAGDPYLVQLTVTGSPNTLG